MENYNKRIHFPCSESNYGRAVLNSKWSWIWVYTVTRTQGLSKSVSILAPGTNNNSWASKIWTSYLPYGIERIDLGDFLR